MSAHDQIREKIEKLSRLAPDLRGGDFLLTWRHGDEAIRFVLLAAEILEDLARAGLSARVFDSGLGMAIFRDRSTRTRYAFKSACNLLGLSTDEFDEGSSQIAHGETVRETATMIGFVTEVIGIRDDMYPGEGHWYMTEVAASLAEAHREGVLMGRPSVLNLQSDLDHPTQSLSDLLHLTRHMGGLGGLRGKRIAVSWAYSPSYAKPLSVPQGAIALLARFGMDIVLAHPEGYELMDEPLAEARRFAAESGGAFRVVHAMEEAFENADVVYAKSWAPAEVMRERTRLLRAGAAARIADLERAALAQNARHTAWTCDEARMALTRGGKAQYMHCLPADVTGLSCAAGEVSRPIFDCARFETYRQAAHKPFVIAAMILGTRVDDPAGALGRLLDAAARRVRG
ncbi:MAG: knotted carbamoyltransferase YgeW [Polyangiaceae bacterium]|nr:knotted carbamoyltransferase YgeW [Polyangiaceae bacterium]